MTGLTNEQVQQRIEEGKINVNENPNTRSYKQIVRENVLTFFNFLNLALMIMVLLVGSYKKDVYKRQALYGAGILLEWRVNPWILNKILDFSKFFE